MKKGKYDFAAFFLCATLVSLTTLMIRDIEKGNLQDKKASVKIAKIETFVYPKRKPPTPMEEISLVYALPAHIFECPAKWKSCQNKNK